MEDDVGYDAILRIRTKDDAIEYAVKVLRYLEAKKGGLSKAETAVWKDRRQLFDRVIREQGIAPDDDPSRDRSKN